MGIAFFKVNFSLVFGMLWQRSPVMGVSRLVDVLVQHRLGHSINFDFSVVQVAVLCRGNVLLICPACEVVIGLAQIKRKYRWTFGICRTDLLYLDFAVGHWSFALQTTRMGWYIFLEEYLLWCLIRLIATFRIVLFL